MIDARLQILDTIVETLPSGLILFHPGGEIFKINIRAKTLLGIPEYKDISRFEDFPPSLDRLVEIFNNPEDVIRSEVSLPLSIYHKRHKDEDEHESEYTIGFSLITLTPPDGPPIRTFTFTDITQILKDRASMDKIKDELAQSKKLASIGTMISGVAHELNNPLTGISMSTDLARRGLEKLKKEFEPKESEEASEANAKTIKTLDVALSEIDKIRKSSEKASVLVGDLLSYSRTSQLNLEPVMLNALVDETVQALKSHPQFSQFSFVIRPPDTQADKQYMVKADRVKLEQVFYNLFKNACDATEGKGTIEIYYTESKASDGAPQVATHVRDNGPGIDTTILARIFDPFFSTKGNQGVGLGLSISYRTIEQHGGLLMVDSDGKSWTEFEVILPVYLVLGGDDPFAMTR